MKMIRNDFARHNAPVVHLLKSSSQPMPYIQSAGDIVIVPVDDASGRHFWRYIVENEQWQFDGNYSSEIGARHPDPIPPYSYKPRHGHNARRDCQS